MADWSDPKRLTAEELERFLLDRRLREEVGFMFNDGQRAVDDVLREAARRLKQSSATEGNADMTVLEWVLMGVIAANFVWKWAKKDNSDYKDMTQRFRELNAKYEDAYAKMRSRIEDEGEKVEVMLERCRKTLERLHGVDMAKRTEEWQSENPEEMERIERKRELKRNPYGF